MGVMRSLMDLITGLFPGVGTSTEDFVSLTQARLTKYRANWIAYYGLDLSQMQAEDGSSAEAVNLLRRNIDKVNYFAFGNDFTITHKRYQKQFDLASQAWGKKKAEKLLRLAQAGSVTGDTFLMVAPRSIANTAVEQTGAKIVEVEGEKAVATEIVTAVLPAEYVTPYYDPFDSERLIKVEIRVPFQVETEDGMTSHYQFIEITPTTIKTGIVDGENNILGQTDTQMDRTLKEQQNPLGRVYVVHIRNYPAGNSIFGLDDVTDAAPLNRACTSRLTDIGKIVEYHAAPITCVYGAKAGSLVRGPNKVWGNLPKDGKVENLTLDTDLGASREHFLDLKEALHVTMGVPEIAQGTKQAISNTSGVALHTMYLPLIERASVKQNLYGPGFIQHASLCLAWCQKLKLMTMTDPETGEVSAVQPLKTQAEWDDFEDNAEISYGTVLPKDRLIEVQIQDLRVKAGLQSRRRAILALGDKDPDTLLKEISQDADEAMERQKALMATQTLPGDEIGDGDEMDEGASDLNGEGRLDANNSSVSSGAEADQGATRTDSGSPKGRPRTQG